MRSELLFRFGRGSSEGGHIVTSIYALSDDTEHVYVHMYPCNDFLYMGEQEFIMPVHEMNEIAIFLNGIKRWKRHYECKDDIDDGEGFDIEFHYEGFEFMSEGYEKFPFGYRRKVALLQTIIEDLCQKYNPDRYDVSGRQKRIRL